MLLVITCDSKLLHKLWLEMTSPVQDGSAHVPDSLASVWNVQDTISGCALFMV